MILVKAWVLTKKSVFFFCFFFFFESKIDFSSNFPKCLEFYVSYYERFWKMADKNINSILFNGYHTFKDLIFKILGMRNFLNQKVNFWVIKSGFSKSLSFDKKNRFFESKRHEFWINIGFLGSKVDCCLEISRNFIWHIMQGFAKRPIKRLIRFYVMIITVSKI